MVDLRKNALFAVLFAICGQAQGQYYSRQLPNKSGDTVFIKREISGDAKDAQYQVYQAVYIENNRTSKYYDRITDFDGKDYNENLRYLSDAFKIKFHENNLYGLPRKWCSLMEYKGLYYAYAPSEWGANYQFQINDSSITYYELDGGIVNALISVKKISARQYQLKMTRPERDNGVAKTNITTTNIYIIDPVKKIAVFESDYWPDYQLMVPAENIKMFPLIVNHCATGKVDEFGGDQINYKALISNCKKQ